MRRTLTLLAAFAWLSMSAVQASEWLWLTENDGLSDARHALLEGDPERAALLAERVLEGAGTTAIGGPPKALLEQAQTLLCICHRLSGDWIRAVSACDRAVALAPNDWRGYVNRAALAIDRRQLAMARKDLERAKTLAPAGEHAVEANLALLTDLQGSN